MRWLIRTGACLGLTLFVTLRLFGQADESQPTNRHVREGYWISIGMGMGSADCNECGARYRGLTGGLSMGGTINQHWLVGGSTFGWEQVGDASGPYPSGLLVQARFYPSATGGFWVTGGAGLGISTVGFTNEVGWVLQGGLGYDVRVSHKVSLAPYVDVFTLSTGPISGNVVRAGIAVTVH